LSIEDILDNIHSKKLNANQGKIQDAVHASISQSPMSIPGMELTSASIIPAEFGNFKVAYAISRTKADSKLKAVLFQDQEQLRSQSRCRRISWKGYLHPPSLDSQSIDVRR